MPSRYLFVAIILGVTTWSLVAEVLKRLEVNPGFAEIFGATVTFLFYFKLLRETTAEP